jgi:hypothetical protein
MFMEPERDAESLGVITLLVIYEKNVLVIEKQLLNWDFLSTVVNVHDIESTKILIIIDRNILLLKKIPYVIIT